MTEPRYVTDGGLETDLIFHHGVELPEFAAFPLVETETGVALLEAYYDGYADIARRAGVGLLLESPTWRANPDWGARVGYDAAALGRVNAASITFLQRLRERYAAELADIRISGMVGPRGDGYVSDGPVDPAAAAEYHAPQLAAFAAAGADQAAALTLTEVGEAIGIVRAANDVGLPIAISFTVDIDGRLPSGTSIAEAIAAVDAAARPLHYLINCAHPSHIGRGLAGEGPWDRVVGVRPNASTQSHAELDAAEELDEGDVGELVAAQRRLDALLPNLSILGGCCGTDARHVAALWA